MPKIKYLSYPEDVVNKVAEEIDALPPQARRLSETAVIKRLRKNIRSGLLKGYTLEQLVDIMRQNGMPITAKTIKSVLEKKSSPRRAKHQVDQTHPASPASIRRKNKTKAAAEPEHAAEPEQFITYEQPTETGVYFKPPPNPPEI